MGLILPVGSYSARWKRPVHLSYTISAVPLSLTARQSYRGRNECAKIPSPIAPRSAHHHASRCVMRASMSEVAPACDDHRQPVLVGGSDHLRVAHRSARLDHG